MKPSLHLRSIHLRVADLTRSVDFYSRQLGFELLTTTQTGAELSAPSLSGKRAPLLQLTEDRSARPAPVDAAGLFHAALLLPDRAALARWLRRAGDLNVNFQGFSDHGVSEAIYLTDPDGNGLEFYADRPRSAWPRENGELAMVTLPLDLPSLLAEASPSSEPLLSGAHWGHFHFRVTNLDRSEKFYSDSLGVTLTQRYGTSARFLGAEGYHHHIGLNTWGHPRLPHPEMGLGLVETAYVRPHAGPRRTLRDPDGITLHISGSD